MERTKLQTPLNSKEHFLYCLAERLDILIDTLSTKEKVNEPETPTATPSKAKRTVKATKE